MPRRRFAASTRRASAATRPMSLRSSASAAATPLATFDCCAEARDDRVFGVELDHVVAAEHDFGVEEGPDSVGLALGTRPYPGDQVPGDLGHRMIDDVDTGVGVAKDLILRDPRHR